MFTAMYFSSFITMDRKCTKIKMANKPLKTDAKKRRGLAGRYTLMKILCTFAFKKWNRFAIRDLL